METSIQPLRDGVTSTVSLERCGDTVSAPATHVFAFSGESDGHSRGAGGHSYAGTVSVNPTSFSSRTSPRMEIHDTSGAGAFVAPPPAAAETSEMLTLDELLDGPASPPGSSGAVPAQSLIVHLTTAAHGGNSEKQGEALTGAATYSEKAVKPATSIERPKEAAVPSEDPEVANLISVSSLSRETPSSVRALRPTPQDSTAAALAQPSAPSAAAASSDVPLSPLTTPPADPLVAAVEETATSQSHQELTSSHVDAAAGSVADQSLVAKGPRAKAEGPPRRPTRAASRSVSRSKRQSASRGHSSSTATPSKRASKSGGATSAYIAALLRGIMGTVMPADRAAAYAPTRGAFFTSSPPLTTLDLPAGLLVLYCTAEEMCAVREDAATPSTSSTAAASAYSLLYILEQLAVARRRERRKAALQMASELGRAKCEELYEAACKKRALDAAHRATRAQAMEQEELGACTFRPAVSKTARRREAKGAKNFLQRCVEWRAEADRRLRQKRQQLAEAEAEEWAATAVQSGISAPGEVITEGSRRLLAQPSVQERLKSRPLLWEVKRPSDGSQGGEESLLAPVQGIADAAASPLQLLGIPLTSATVEEQEAFLRRLRWPEAEAGASGEPSLLLQQHNTSAARASKSFRNTVKGFLSRVEQDAEQREQNAAKLQVRYHDPEAERFERATGRPLFHPNAMPIAWKDGHRVSFDELPKEKQEEVRAELRRAGLDFVVSHYLRERQREKQKSAGGSSRKSSAPRQGDDGDATEGSAAPRRYTSPKLHGDVMKGYQARFMASLEAALARKKKNCERLRAEATAEETFHPQITKRSARMALHKTGGTPLYERLVKPKEGASVAGARSEKSQAQLSSSADKDQPLPDVVRLFLTRNGQWIDLRQRRLQHLAEVEEERRRAGCTFTPNRHYANVYEVAELAPGVQGSLMSASLLTGSAAVASAAAEDTENCRGASQLHVRLQDLMASAADVRVMNELELLRSGAAYRDELFVQSVCEQSGLANTKQAMASLSLHSAPRLSRGLKGARGPSRSPHQPSALLSQSHLSPIPQRSNRPSASPYLLPRRDTRALSASFHESAPMRVLTRSQSDSTQTPLRHSLVRGARGARSGACDSASNAPPVEDPWAALDAQIDAILKRPRR
ncbi:hypothetical protein GH5_03260 [Leishmania sp. Ghana 2012 LV757]|uniref:hypothetical protein n=1 Tax=Leishmania sp. Ghana 2012 LV757 TaxID=2803181 RepID=UPI001B5D63F3|nr:hypothetical protein GH5_03260 [Leishmania sp. Ghana 2012 LV757]